MKDKLRMNEWNAKHRAARHAEATGHRAKVRTVETSNPEETTNERTEEVSGLVTSSADD